MPHHARPRSFTRVALLALPLVACAAGRGAAPAVVPTERPSYAVGAAVVPRGGAQLEAGYTLARAAGGTQHTFGESLLRVGVGAGTEVRAHVSSLAVRTGALAAGRPAGLDDATVSVKRALALGRGGRRLPAARAALVAETTVPVGSAAYGTAAWQPGATLVVEVPAGERLGLAVNAGGTWAALPRATGTGAPAAGLVRRAQARATAVASWAWSARVGAYAEWAGSRLVRPGAPVQQWVDGGVTVAAAPGVQLDLRVGLGRSGVPGERLLGVGVTRRW